MTNVYILSKISKPKEVQKMISWEETQKNKKLQRFFENEVLDLEEGSHN